MPYRHEIIGGDFSIPVIPPPPGHEQHSNPPTKVMYENTVPDEIIKENVRARAWRPVNDIVVYRCECQRCPKIWFSLMQSPPKTCPTCRSAWWMEPRSPHMAPPADPKPKRGQKNRAGKSKGGSSRGPGRPRKYAPRELVANRGVEPAVVAEEALPDIPLEVLEAVGTTQNTPDAGGRVGQAAVDEDFPVATPLDDGLPLPSVSGVIADQAPRSGQPAHDGGLPTAPVEDRFADGPPPTFEDDDWERFG